MCNKSNTREKLLLLVMGVIDVYCCCLYCLCHFYHCCSRHCFVATMLLSLSMYCCWHYLIFCIYRCICSNPWPSSCIGDLQRWLEHRRLLQTSLDLHWARLSASSHGWGRWQCEMNVKRTISIEDAKVKVYDSRGWRRWLYLMNVLREGDGNGDAKVKVYEDKIPVKCLSHLL